jgi:hypothetical protein
MNLDLVWAEGVPPEVERAVKDAINSVQAAIRVSRENPGCPVAGAALQAALKEGYLVQSRLQEFTA